MQAPPCSDLSVGEVFLSGPTQFGNLVSCEALHKEHTERFLKGALKDTKG